MEQHVQRYTKYIYEAVRKMDLDAATYKDHLHKVFEWYGCIQLSRESGRTVLRWEDVSAEEREKKGMSRDMGIDAWDRDGDRVIQMKLYNGLIGWRSFSTFWSACHTCFEDSEKILYRNTESTIHPLIQTNVQKGKLRDMTVTDAEFRGACRKIQKIRWKQAGAEVEEVVLRPYQMEAMAMMEKAKEEGLNLMVCLPTGTGKTVITLQYHLAHGVPSGEKMLILVPTLVLMEQWSDACKKVGVEAYLIGTNQHRSLGEYAEQSIVICVYDSFGAIMEEVAQFGRIVVDEAHHVLVPERYMETEQDFSGSDEDEDEDEWEEEEDQEDKKEERSVSYMSHIRSLAKTQQVIYLSATMDKPEDESLFYEYKVRQAIQDGYLCDYEFVFPIFEREYDTNQHLAEYLVHRQQETHCLIYASNRVEGKEFVDRLNALQPGCAGYVDGMTRPVSRKKIFREFEEGTIRFLINIRVLVEGFNAPHIRSIFFLHVSSSDIFIIQAIGRALRLHADKMKAMVYVPFTHEGDIDRIHAFLTQLVSYDERVGESILGKRVGGYVRVERGEAEAEGEEDGDEKCDGDEKEEVFEFRYNLVVDRMGVGEELEAMALRKAEEYISWVGEKGRSPAQRSKAKRKEEDTEEQLNEYRLAKWIQHMKDAKQGKGMGRLYPSVESRLVDVFGEGWWEKRDLEQHQLKQANDYITWVKKNDRVPSCHRLPLNKQSDTQDERQEEYRLTGWMSNRKNIKRGKGMGRLYPSVEKLLIETFGEGWWEKENLEKTQMEKANEYITWVTQHNRHPRKRLASKRKSDIITDEQRIEHQYSAWFDQTQQSKKGGRSKLLYASVDQRLTEVFGEEWYKTRDSEGNLLKQANDYISWVNRNNRYPVKCLQSNTQKESGTEEQKIEDKYAQWMGDVKKSIWKKGGRKSIYPSVVKLLNEELGEEWCYTLEQYQLKQANDYIAWVNINSRYPVNCIQSKKRKKSATEEQKIEYYHALRMVYFKQTKKGKGKGILYPSVEQRLVEAFGPEWHTAKA
jgi:superfamily II DNA or RNA helicase